MVLKERNKLTIDQLIFPSFILYHANLTRAILSIPVKYLLGVKCAIGEGSLLVNAATIPDVEF